MAPQVAQIAQLSERNMGLGQQSGARQLSQGVASIASVLTLAATIARVLSRCARRRS